MQCVWWGGDTRALPKLDAHLTSGSVVTSTELTLSDTTTMPPSIDTGECEKKVVEVVNTEELPLNAPETGDEAKAKPEDMIAEEENKNDKTEESAETEKNISELAQPEGDSTPPVVVDQTPPGEMPGNAGEVKEEKCEDLVEEEGEQNKPQLAVEEYPFQQFNDNAPILCNEFR